MDHMRPDHTKTYPKTANDQLSKEYNRTFRKNVLAKTQSKINIQNGSSAISADSPNDQKIISLYNYNNKEELSPTLSRFREIGLKSIAEKEFGKSKSGTVLFKPNLNIKLSKFKGPSQDRHDQPPLSPTRSNYSNGLT